MYTRKLSLLALALALALVHIVPAFGASEASRKVDADFLVPVDAAETAAFAGRPCMAFDPESGIMYVLYVKPSNGRLFGAACDVYAETCEAEVDLADAAGWGDNSSAPLFSCGFFEASLVAVVERADLGGSASLLVCTDAMAACSAIDVSTDPRSGVRPALAFDSDSATALVAATGEQGAVALYLCDLAELGDCKFVDLPRSAGIPSAEDTGHYASIDAGPDALYVASIDMAPRAGGKRVMLWKCALDGTACSYADATASAALLGSTSSFHPRLRFSAKDEVAAPIVIAIGLEDAVLPNSAGLLTCTPNLACKLTDVTAASGAAAESGFMPVLDVDSSSGQMYVASHAADTSLDAVELFTCEPGAAVPLQCTHETLTGLGVGAGSALVDVLFDQGAWSLVLAHMNANGVAVRRRTAACETPGFALADTNSCEACPAGTLVDSAGRVAVCELCPPDTYSAEPASDACAPCPEDAYCPAGSRAPLQPDRAVSGAAVPDIARVSDEDFADARLVERVFIGLAIAIGAFAVVFGLLLSIFLCALGAERRSTFKQKVFKLDLFAREPPAKNKGKASRDASEGEDGDEEQEDSSAIFPTEAKSKNAKSKTAKPPLKSAKAKAAKQSTDGADDADECNADAGGEDAGKEDDDSAVDAAPQQRLRTLFGGFMGVVAIFACICAIAALAVQLQYNNAIITTSQQIGENALDEPIAERPSPRLRVVLTLEGVEPSACTPVPASGTGGGSREASGSAEGADEGGGECPSDFALEEGFPSFAEIAPPHCAVQNAACVITWECLSGCRLFSAPSVRFAYPGAGYATAAAMQVAVSLEGFDYDEAGRGAVVSFVAAPSGPDAVLQRQDEDDEREFVFGVSIFQRLLRDNRAAAEEPTERIGFALVEPALRARGSEVPASEAAVLPELEPGVPAIRVVFSPQPFHEVTEVVDKDSPVSFLSIVGGAVSGVMGLAASVVKAADVAEKHGLTILAAFAAWRLGRRAAKDEEAASDTDEASTGRWVSSSEGSEGTTVTEANNWAPRRQNMDRVVKKRAGAPGAGR